MGTARERLREAKRIVVKVGTSTLTHETGKLNLHRIDLLLREIADLKNQGKEMILGRHCRRFGLAGAYEKAGLHSGKAGGSGYRAGRAHAYL